jgi:hypothetical protein
VSHTARHPACQADRRKVLGPEPGLRPRFLYTIPAFQNPTGVNLSAPRRTAEPTVGRCRAGFISAFRRQIPDWYLSAERNIDCVKIFTSPKHLEFFREIHLALPGGN